MPFCTMLLPPYTNEMDDTIQPGLEESYSYSYPWTRDSWENSDSSENLNDSATAVNKPLIFTVPADDSLSTEWTTKSVRQWASDDVMYWIIAVANDRGLNTEEIGMSRFRGIDGTTLYTMTEADFVARDSRYGTFFYPILQRLKHEQDQQMAHNKLPPVTTFKSEERVFVNLTSPCHSENHQSSDESEVGVPVPPAAIPGKRGPGRPRVHGRKGKKTEKKTGRLWEFIRDLLLNRDYCPSLICWENHDEGMFRFVRSEKVAKLWGTLKENPKMTYEKLSRAMRYYYKSKVLQPVVGRRLVYKFGPTATGWKTANPNFRV